MALYVYIAIGAALDLLFLVLAHRTSRWALAAAALFFLWFTQGERLLAYAS